MKPKYIIVLFLTVGVGLFLYSLTLPYYKDEKLANDLMVNSNKIDESEYYKKNAELRTNKVSLMDLGAGISIASITVLLYLIFTKINTFKDLKNSKSLSKSNTFVFSNLVWLILLPGTYWYYLYRELRGDYPPFADSIGIPIMTQIPVYAFLLIPLNVFILLTTIKTYLPTKLFIKSSQYNRTLILWEIFFGFWILINIVILIEFVKYGDHLSIPVNLFFTFILLTLRAGKISHYEQIENENQTPINNISN